MTATSQRRCKIGVLLPLIEGMLGDRTASWTDIYTFAQRAESLGFDSVWLSDHLLLPVGDWIEGAEPLGAWECWSVLAAVAASTEQLEIGSLVLCTPFRNPALIAKMAATVDETSGGRLILGLGAGSVEAELQGFGFDAERRVSRFEEAIQIITGLLRNQEIDFSGQFYQLEKCELRPRGPRAQGPPVMIGARGERMFQITARHADMWNGAWTSRAEQMQQRLELLDDTCRLIGRDPTTLKRTAGIMIEIEEAGPNREWMSLHPIPKPFEPMTGSTEDLAAALHAYQRLGIDHIQVWLNPTTIAGLEAFAPVLELLD
jgi:probable F420-dependent oxidoreductase